MKNNLPNRKVFIYIFWSLSLLLTLLPQIALGQQSITAQGVAFTQDFAIGTSATASLPTGFKFGSANGTDWTGGLTATVATFGTTGSGAVTGTSSGNYLNWANGIAGSATDRSIGFLTSGSFSSPRSIIYAFTNNTPGTITSLSISWNYEKMRSGSRQYDWTFFHGSTSSPTTAATSGNQNYPADANNTVISNPPLQVAKTVSLTGLSIPVGGVYYLRWTYTGLAGSSNSQGLSIDDFSIIAAGSVQATNVTAGTPTFNTIPNITATNGSGTSRAVFIAQASTGAAAPVNNTTYTANTVFGSGTQIGATGWYCVYNGTGTPNVSVSGLTASTTYRVMVCEYEGGAGTESYNTSTATGNPENFTTDVAPGFPVLTITGTTGHGSHCLTVSGTPIEYTVTNSGTVQAEDITISLNTNSAEFAVTTPLSNTVIPAGQSVTFSVTFTAANVGGRSTDIEVTSSTVNSNIATITLTGTGLTSASQTVSTNAADGIVNTLATLHGDVTALGTCASTTEKGFVYAETSVNSNPEVGGTGTTSETVAGLTTGAYSKAITGLTPNTSYSYVAYVYNGTTYNYGSVQTFTTLTPADHLFFSVNPPTTGGVNTNLASFTVQARRADNSVDTEYTTAITISKTTGPGNLSGATASTVAGVATYTTAQFDAVGTYTIEAASGALATVQNPTVITISLPNAAAIVWSGVASCAGGNGSAWLTTTFWCGNVLPSATTVAQFGALGTNVVTGMNMNTATAVQKSVGALEVTAASTIAKRIVNSSTTVSGDMTLNGVVVNSIANTIVRNASANLMTIRRDENANALLGIILGNATDNIINTDGAGGVTITAVISGLSRQLTKIGNATLTLGGANTYTGATTIQDGTLTLSGANALPITASAGVVHFAGGTPTFNLGNVNLGTSTAAANSAGELDFDVNTTVNLGTGDRSYYFKGSSTQTWNATAITINNWIGAGGTAATTNNPKIFIGSTNTDLTSGQLAMIHFTGFPVGAIQLATGEVVPAASAPVILSFPPSGCAGTSMTISGTNLSNATSVTIGGTPATITANDDASITVTIGNGTTGLISVTTPNGTGTSVDPFEVNPLPTATISGTTTVCLDATAPEITFTGADGTAPYIFTYTVNGGDNLSVGTSIGDSVTVSVPTNVAGTFTYTLVSVEDSSTSGCLNLQSGSAVITVGSQVTYYEDGDGDGYGNNSNFVLSCNGAPEGYVLNMTDCDDANGAIFASGSLYIDNDSDGYDAGLENVCYNGVTPPAGYSSTSNGTDCNDNNGNVYQSQLLYIDADGDGWDAGQTTICYGASIPSGYSVSTLGTDCNDAVYSLTNECNAGSVVNLTLLVDSYHVGGGVMNSVKFNRDFVSDTDEVEELTVELHDAVTYALVDTATGMLMTDGSLSVTFTTAAAGSYYIVVKGFNLIQTWSAEPQAVGTTPLSYDFTSASSQAYADNMREVEPGVWAIYNGDVNQDENIDGSDYTVWELDANEFAFGFYATDINGDGNVDGSDYTIWEANANNFIYSAHP